MATKVLAASLLLATVAIATHQWRTGQVTELTSARAQSAENREITVPAVWISETDGNRKYLILAESYSGPKRTKVVFHVGDTVKFQRAGETSAINGFLDVRYTDNKGKEKSELHMIAKVGVQ